MLQQRMKEQILVFLKQSTIFVAKFEITDLSLKTNDKYFHLFL